MLPAGYYHMHVRCRERATQERMAFLRANDVEAYLRLAQNAKNSRLNELLSSTDACLRHLSNRLRLASSVLVKAAPGAKSSDMDGKTHAAREEPHLFRMQQSPTGWDVAYSLCLFR